MMTGDVTTDKFVLQPAVDIHARAALMFYAKRIEHQNPALAAYLRAWVTRLYHVESSAKLLTGPPDLPDWLLQQSKDS